MHGGAASRPMLARCVMLELRSSTKRLNARLGGGACIPRSKCPQIPLTAERTPTPTLTSALSLTPVKVSTSRLASTWATDAFGNSQLLRRRNGRSSFRACRAAMTSSSPWQREDMAVAVEAVTRACQLAVQVQRDFLRSSSTSGVLEKGDQTPVTVADYAIQALITLELECAFPGILLLGEEDTTDLQSPSAKQLLQRVTSLVRHFCSGAVRGAVDEGAVLQALGEQSSPARGEAGSSAKYWILDPIDGTRGFLLGAEAQYVIGLALVEDDEVVGGVMGLPNMPLPSADAQFCTSHRRGSSPPCQGTSTIPQALSVQEERAAQSPATQLGLQTSHPLPSTESVAPSAVHHISGASERGLMIAASKGAGAWVRPLHSGAALGCTEGEASEDSSTLSKHASFTRCLVDSACDVRAGVVCISDHERFEDLPLAQGLACSAQGGMRGQPRVMTLCCGSLCKYAAVCLGQASVFVQHPTPLGSVKPLKVWDHAAGVICVEEAAGKVTDFRGQSLQLGSLQRTFLPGGGGVLVSNSTVHPQVLDLLSLKLI